MQNVSKKHTRAGACNRAIFATRFEEIVVFLAIVARRLFRIVFHRAALAIQWTF